MPIPIIPIIFGAASLYAAATGVSKGKKAYDDINESKNINCEAEDFVRQADNRISENKNRAMDRIEKLGEAKIEILSTSISDFVDNFSKIKNVNLKSSEGLDELQYFNAHSEEFIELKESAFTAKNMAINGMAAIGGGALLAYGSYSTVIGGGFALASTGASIAGLSGAAATNATLAWLGGGSLAAGGLGMTGGMVVLGGLVVGPALALGGSLFASQAKKALNEAYINKEKAEIYSEQSKNIVLVLKGMMIRASQLTGLLRILNQYFIKSIDCLKSTIEKYGTNWNDYPKEEQQQIYASVQLAKTIKIILDTTLLNQDGALEEKSYESLMIGQQYISKLEEL